MQLGFFKPNSVADLEACWHGIRSTFTSLRMKKAFVKKISVMVIASALLLNGCASQGRSENKDVACVVVVDQAVFRSEGIATGSQSTAKLAKNTKVSLVKRGVGSSLVKLEDGRTGYISNSHFELSASNPKARESSGNAAGATNVKSESNPSAPVNKYWPPPERLEFRY